MLWKYIFLSKFCHNFTIGGMTSWKAIFENTYCKLGQVRVVSSSFHPSLRPYSHVWSCHVKTWEALKISWADASMLAENMSLSQPCKNSHEKRKNIFVIVKMLFWYFIYSSPFKNVHEKWELYVYVSYGVLRWLTDNM